LRNPIKVCSLPPALIIMLAALLISGSCTVRTVQPRPETGYWRKCPVCKGYGTVVSYHAKELSKKRNGRDDDETLGGCMYFFVPGSKLDDYNADIENRQNEGTYQDPYNPGKSYKKSVTKCSFCDGTGWIKTRKKTE